MIVEEMAEQIREVHQICQNWEVQPASDAFKRPRWTRGFQFLYAVAAFGVLLGAGAILSRSLNEATYKSNVEIWVLSVVSLWLAYCTIATGIDLFFLAKGLRQLGKPFSTDDAVNLEDWLRFEVKISKLSSLVVENAASWLEMRSRKIENARTFAVGLATLGSGVLGFLLLPGSPLKSVLAQRISGDWIVALQLWIFLGLVGAVIAIGAGWNHGIRCANRALTLRRILANRDMSLGLEEAHSPKS